MFSYISPEDRVPQDHPLRVIRGLVDPILARMSPQFEALYSRWGRRSIAPEKLLRALLLQVLYTIRSERQLMEQIDYNILYRWFVGLNLDEPVWVPTVFTKNRDRLLRGQIADVFLVEVINAAEDRGLLSDEHFSVDGTLLEAWASHKSFRRKDGSSPPSDGDSGNPTVDFRKEKRKNATHRSVTDPEARLARKGGIGEPKLSYQGSVLIDNRHGLVVGAHVTQPGYDAECESALEMLASLPPGGGRRTLAADKGYDHDEFVVAVRSLGVTPHVAPNVHKFKPRTLIDARTTRHPGFAVSQQQRKRVEEVFGWSKVIGLLRKLHHRGTERVDWIFTFTTAVYNLVRLRTLIRAGVCT
jgi:transposase